MAVVTGSTKTGSCDVTLVATETLNPEPTACAVGPAFDFPNPASPKNKNA